MMSAHDTEDTDMSGRVEPNKKDHPNKGRGGYFSHNQH